MKVILEQYLQEVGYQKIATNLSEFSMLFRSNANSVEVISLIDDRLQLFLEPTQYANIKTQAEQFFRDQGYQNIHILTLILADDLQKIRKLGQNDRFCWMIDRNRKSIVMFENQVDDFYGLRKKLEAFLEDKRYESDITLQPKAKQYKGDIRKQIDKSSVKKYINVTNTIILINVIIFVICTFTGNVLYNKGAISLDSLRLNQEYYRLLSSMFLHADAEHILGNMLILFMAGKYVEKILGSFRFSILYIATGVLGSVVSLIMQSIKLEFYTSIGASGAVFGILGGLLFFVAIKHKEVEIITGPRLLFYLIYSIYIGSRATNIDNYAHIGGMLSGIVITFVLWFTISKKKGNRGDED